MTDKHRYGFDIAPPRQYALAKKRVVLLRDPFAVPKGHILIGRGKFLYWSEEEKKSPPKGGSGPRVLHPNNLIFPIMYYEDNAVISKFETMRLMVFPQACCELILQTFPTFPAAASIETVSPAGLRDWELFFDNNAWNVEKIADVSFIDIDQDFIDSIPPVEDRIWWTPPEEGGHRWELYANLK